MKISIVTPTYNRKQLLSRLHGTLLAQSGVNIEWVIIDDGGTDGTEEMIRTFPRSENIEIRYFWKENGGKNSAANAGLEMASGDLVSIIDDDDYFLPDVFGRIQQDYLAIKDNEAIAGLSYLCHDGDGKVMGQLFPEDGMISDHIECRINLNIVGDKCEFTKVSALREGQIHFSKCHGSSVGDTGYLVAIARKYKTQYFNFAVLVKIFTVAGVSVNWRKRLLTAPAGAAEYYRAYLYKQVRFKIRVRYMVAYMAIMRFMRAPLDRAIAFAPWNVAPTVLAYFPGQIMGLLWRLQYKHGLTRTRKEMANTGKL